MQEERLSLFGKLLHDRKNDAIDVRLNLAKQGLSEDELKAYDFENSKINTAAIKIKELANKWESEKGTQLVFIDDANAMQVDLKEKLIKLGFKDDEVAILHKINKKDLLKTYEKINNGEIRVLISSRKLAGTGVNIQKRIVALHNVTPTWNASDYSQGLGRVIRQGNELNAKYDDFSVDVINYISEDSFDSVMFNKLAQKDKAAKDFFRADSNLANSVEEFTDTLSFSELEKQSNAKLKALSDIKEQMKKLNAKRLSIKASNEQIKNDLAKYENLSKNSLALRDLLNDIKVSKSDNVEFRNSVYEKNAELNKMMINELRTNPNAVDFFANYNGVNINFKRIFADEFNFFITNEKTNYNLVQNYKLSDSSRIFTILDNAFKRLEDVKSENAKVFINANKKLKDLRAAKLQDESIYDEEIAILKAKYEEVKQKNDEELIRLNNVNNESLRQEIKENDKNIINETIKEEIKPIANETKLSDDESLAMLEKHLKEREYFLEFMNDINEYNAKLTFNDFFDNAINDLYFENQKFFGKIANNEELKEKIANDLFKKYRTREEPKTLKNDLANKSKDELLNIAKEDNLSVKELNVMLLKKQIAEFRTNPLSNRIDIKKRLDYEDKKEILKTLARFGNSNLDDEFLDSIIKNKNTSDFINRLELNKELKQVVSNEKELIRLVDVVLFKNGDGAYINAALLPNLSDDELIKYAANKKLIPAIKISENKKDEVMLKFLDFVKADKLKGAKTKLKNMRSLEKLNWYDDKVTKRIDEFVYDYVDRTMFNDYHLEADYLYEIKQNLKDLLFNNRINIDIFADSKVSDFM